MNACVGGGGAGSVISLTGSNFKSLVTESKDLWMVEFFAPWVRLGIHYDRC